MMAYSRGYKKNGYGGYRKRAPAHAAKPAVPRSERVWSPLQMDIFSFISESNDNGVVIARAGSGKTTTLEESVRRAYESRPNAKIAVVAFNRAIKTEVAQRLSDLTKSGNVDVLTCHSLGFRICRRAFRSGQPDDMKVIRIIESIIGPEEEKKDLAEQLKDCISKVKLTLTDWTSPKARDAIDSVIDEYGIDLGKGASESDRSEFINVVQKSLAICRQQTGIIDFDDMLWLPIVHNKITSMFDIIFVDETQDLNKAQLKLILGCLNPGGRIIAVGDDRQAIYKFMGADEKSIPTIIDTLKAKVLKLNWTYRCGKAIVELAKTVVPDLEAAPGAAEGSVKDVLFEEAVTQMAPGDFVLSRKNAPLMKICMMLLKRGIPANIQGADFAKGLMWTIKKSQASTVADLVKYVEDWRSSEKKRLEEKKRNSDWVDDKADCILAFAENALTIDAVKANIRRMFDDRDETSRVTLSSTHKAKGLERDRVFMLTDTYSHKNTEESNLWYVAVTRAKKELYLVEGLP